jgi:hypothetical protein
MNERIKELLNEAEKSVTFLSNSNESKHQIAMQRFAELIVKKCIDIVLDCSIPGSNNERDFIVASREIRHHFGVEE